MKAFLEKHGPEWLDDFVYISNMPLQRLGVEVIAFDGSDLKGFLERTHFGPDDIVIGSVEAVSASFEARGMKCPDYLGYPDSLEPFLRRKIERMKYKEISLPYPFFVKPAVDVKQFTGSLVENQRQANILLDFMGCSMGTEVFVSEPIEFASEYRCFVHKGELKGIQWYAGDFTTFPNLYEIHKMIKAYKDAPIAYTLDIGIINGTNINALVEVNDMWAIGSYGFNGADYVRMTIDRFQEIKKQNA